MKNIITGMDTIRLSKNVIEQYGVVNGLCISCLRLRFIQGFKDFFQVFIASQHCNVRMFPTIVRNGHHTLWIIHLITEFAAHIIRVDSSPAV